MLPETSAALREIEQLLAAQIQRLRRRYLVHGLAWACVLFLGFGAAYFVLDRLLHLPLAVRLLFSAAYVLVMLLLLRRRIVYPLRRPITADDMALAIERHDPGLQQELISALQLAHGDLRDSRALAAAVVARARERIPRLPLDRLLDDRRTLRLVGGACAVALLALAGAWNHAESVRVFVQRALAFEVMYPRATMLLLELPSDGADHRVERPAPDHVVVTMAAGADLPVLVRVEGVQPREVELVVSGGRGIPPVVAMTSRGAERFRHVFRRVQADFTFYARGGDDPAGDATVDVHVVHPPLVRSIRAVVTPPAYTGRPPTELTGGAIEALAGSQVRVEVTPTAPAATAALVFLESGGRLELEPRITSDDAGRRELLTAEFLVTRSDRYQVELVGGSGLRNPHPGHYPIVVIPDHPPAGRLLLPLDDSLQVVLPAGRIPLRAELRDDHGLRRAELRIAAGKQEPATTLPLLEQQPLTSGHVVFRLLAVDAMKLGDRAPAVGDSLTLAIELTDNREPEAQLTKLPPRTVYVVAENDLLRRLTSHFRRLRDDVESLETLQRDRAERLTDLVQDRAATAEPAQLRTDLTLIEVGQGRVLDGLGRLHRELARGFDVHLLNGLEPSDAAQRALEIYAEEQARDASAEAFLPGIYRRMAQERQAGRLGRMEKVLDPLLTMLLAADGALLGPAPACVQALAGAQVAPGTPARLDALRQAQEHQRQILTVLEQLRARLDEWNEFQDVVAQARALLDKQREVQSRTKLQIGEKK